MTKQLIRWLLSLTVCLSGGIAVAQEAFITQVGDQNAGINLASGSGNVQDLRQSGSDNGALQSALGHRNTQFSYQSGISSSLLADVDAGLIGIGEDGLGGLAPQTGVDNLAVAFIQGSDNSTAAVQLGRGNTSALDIRGDDNSIGVLQFGEYHRATVTVYGNRSDVGVAQFGRGRVTNLEVYDYLDESRRGSATDRLQVGVFQSGNDAQLDARVGRNSAGEIVIQPLM